MTNVVDAVFGGSRETRTRGLNQWDYGQILRFPDIELPYTYTVHFSNEPLGGKAKMQIGDADGVVIPDEYLETGRPVYAWVFLHTGEDDGETVYSITIPVMPRPEPTEEEPTPAQQELIEQIIVSLNRAVGDAEDARDAIENMSVSAETLAPGSTATVEKTVDPQTGAVSLGFGIPRGDQGEKGDTGAPGAQGPQGIPGQDGANGQDGADGEDGVSPTVAVSTITGGHRVTVTDAEGDHAFDVMDGERGATGQTGPAGADGADGFSPTASVSKSGGTATISITDKNGTTTATVSDGQNGTDGAPGVGVPTGGTTGQVLKKKSGTDYDTEWGNPVTDVQVNGTSVVNNGVANIPQAENDSLGVVKPYSNNGIAIVGSTGRLFINKSDDVHIKVGTNDYRPIVPSNQHIAAFYGLAKAAGDTTQSSSSNAVGTYTADALVKIQKMLGVYQAPWELIREDTATNAAEADVDITVDSNGNTFELTDIRLMYWLPTQASQAGKGDYGKVLFYYGDSSFDTEYNGSWTQAANTTGRIAFCEIEQSDGMISKKYTKNSSISSDIAIYCSGYLDTTPTAVRWQIANRAYRRISITKVTGQLQYKLFGRRKWTI